MKENEVRALAETILRPLLGPFGFVSADVETRPDHDGDDSFVVTAHFKKGSEVASGRTYVNAQVAMIDALALHGENRFPYFRYDYPDEPAPFDEDEIYGAH